MKTKTTKQKQDRKKVDWKRIISVPFLLAILLPAVLINLIQDPIAKYVSSAMYILIAWYGTFEILKSMKFHWSVSIIASAGMALFFLISIDNYKNVAIIGSDNNLSDPLALKTLLPMAINWKSYIIIIGFSFLPLLAQFNVIKKHWWQSQISITLLFLIIATFVKALWVINIAHPIAILFFVGSVVLSDTFAYIGGKYLGEKIFRGLKLAPRLSPKKTWAGFIVSFFITFTFAVIVGYFCNIWDYMLINDHGVVTSETAKVWLTISMAVLVSVMAPMGDLVFSGVKRLHEIKDFSKLIPGHGGVFDRLDSLSFIVFFTTMLSLITI